MDAVTDQVKWSNYLYAAGAMVGVVDEVIEAATPAVKTETVRYFHLDHLGSIAKITDAAGQVAENLSFDPWGKRRFTSGADDPLETILSGERRGFTGHEHLAAVGLVHMNGRIYDPLIGRFLSADPFVKDPKNLQNLNRYAYVNNNPLSYTDPTGYFIKKIFKGVTKVAKAIRRFTKSITRSVIRAVPQSVARVAVAVGSTICFGGYAACVAAGNYEISRAHGVPATQAFKGAVFAAASAAVTSGIGWMGQENILGMGNLYVRALAHGVSHGGLAVAQGGNFGPTFLSGVFSVVGGAHLDAQIPAGLQGNFAAEATGRVIIGGTASVIGGGKFANGAITAAFIYAFNDYRHPDKSAACRANRQHCIAFNDNWNTGDKSFYSPGSNESAMIRVSNEPGVIPYGLSASLVGITGGEVTAGYYLSLPDFDVGVFGSAGGAVGIDVGASLFIGYILTCSPEKSLFWS